jgi:hypothetical protein
MKTIELTDEEANYLESLLVSEFHNPYSGTLPTDIRRKLLQAEVPANEETP